MIAKTMKRLSLLLAIMMIFSTILITSVSAAYDVVDFKFLPLEGFDVSVGAVKDQQFWIAVEYDSVNTGVCYTKFEMEFDQTKIEYSAGSHTSNPGTRYPGMIPSGTAGDLNDLNKASGLIISNKVAGVNWFYENDDLEEVILTRGALAIFRFKVLTAEATNVTLKFNGTWANSAKAVGSDVLSTTSTDLTIPLNGGAPVISDPLVTLGAKVNESKNGLRFGSQYFKIAENGEVVDLGMLLYPTAKLGTDTLDLAYYAANPYSASNTTGVLKIKAAGIEEFVPEKAFENYDDFVFYVSLINIAEDNKDTDVTAVPYIEYADGTVVYGDAVSRSFNYVLGELAE